MNHKPAAVRGLPLLAAAAVLTLLLACMCMAQADSEQVLAPENPDFLYYVDNPHMVMEQASGHNYFGGLVPEPFDLSSMAPMSTSSMNVVSFPNSYDLRALGKLTPVRNQGSCGSCWDFAAIGSLESSLMPSELWDFSENNLKNLAGFALGCCSGGNRAMATAYLVRWGGPIAEVDDKYNAGSCYSPTGLTPRKHVQNVLFVPNRSSSLDNNAIKQAVMTYGAVYTTYYHSDVYYNSSTASYYYFGGNRANHAVCIVGWDDNYPANRFLATPPGNGAFLIRNSWGTWWGMSGYFWMSYHDVTLARTENAVFTAEPAANYDQVYQYDPLGWTSNTGYGSNTAWFANVFTATVNSSVAAASWYAPVPNASYALYVYTNPTSGPVNSSGAVISTAGTLETAGYHTVKLPVGVPIVAGQKFSVVVKLTTPGYSYPICLERPYSGYSTGATASKGQSFMSGNGSSWTDVAGYYSNTNVCLKAFTSGSAAPTPTPGALSVTPNTGLSASGNVGGTFSPSSQAYTLTNTGGSSINWSVSATKPWLSLSSASGSLAAGATATVTVSINSSANSLAAGSHSDSVSFANTTNGSGNTARSVSLTVNPAPTPGALAISPSTGLSASGNVGGPFSPSSQAYTLTNTGGSPINWTASATTPWLSISSKSGSLAAGASATVTVSINSSANSLAAGSYSDSVSFTNTANGAGSSTRAVSLNVANVTPPPPPPPPSSDDYQVSPTTYGWINPAYHSNIALSTNSVSGAVILPFTFTYYGKPYSRLFIGSNGLMGFTNSAMNLSNNTDIPSTTLPNLGIYPYWDALSMAGASVKAAQVGSAPNRRVVISWVGVSSAALTTAKFTFQAILCEGTNDIVFQYQNVAGATAYGAGASATIGIENETGTKACKFSYNTKSLADGMAIRFTPSPTNVGRRL